MVKQHDLEIESVDRGEKRVRELGGFRNEWTFIHLGRGRWAVRNARGELVFEASGGFDAVLSRFAGN